MTERKSYHYSKGRHCSTCGTAAVRNSSKSGICRTCWLKASVTDEEFQRKRRDGIIRRLREDPAHAARMRDNMRKVSLAAAQDPELRRRRQERGRFMYENYLNKPETRAKIKATRPAVARRLSEQALSWCPLYKRDDYKFLVAEKRVKAAEARRMIEDEVARDIGKMTPFERQMWALQNGAKLVEMPARATLDRPGVFRS